MASSAEARGSLLQAAGVEDEEESTAPSSAVRVSLPSREGGSPAVESAPRTPPGDPLSSPWRSSLFSPRDVSLSAVRRVVDGSSQTQDSFYDTTSTRDQRWPHASVPPLAEPSDSSCPQLLRLHTVAYGAA